MLERDLFSIIGLDGLVFPRKQEVADSNRARVYCLILIRVTVLTGFDHLYLVHISLIPSNYCTVLYILVLLLKSPIGNITLQNLFELP